MCMYYITGSRIVLHEILNIPFKFRRHNRIPTHFCHVGESMQQNGQIKIIFIETITLATITFTERTSVLKMSLRVFSHLAHCFRTWHVSPRSSVHLGICEHNNANTIGPRSPERGGLGLIENELWSGSVVVKKQSDPTDQRTRLYHTV